MTGIIRLILGSLFAAVAMFVIGFVFWATPLARLAYTAAPDATGAATQVTLAQNLTATGTGTYLIPSPADSAQSTVLYGRGPIATVHFNTQGFPVADTAAMVVGFVHEFVIALVIGFALYGIATRVTDFASQARLILLFAVAAAGLTHLATPIWFHYDWAWAIFNFLSDFATLAVAGLIIARWFLPRIAVIPPVAATVLSEPIDDTAASAI